MVARDRHDETASRRAFLARAAALAVPAVLAPLAACGRRDPADGVAAEAAVEPGENPIVAAEPGVVEAAPPGVPTVPTVEPVVRVRVGRVRRDPARVTVDAERGWLPCRVVEDDDGSGAASGAEADALGTVAGVLHAPVEVVRRDGTWSVLDARGFRAAAPDGASIVLGDAREPARAEVIVDDRVYPGVVRLVPRPKEGRRAFDVVNDVLVERYLPGVLEKELYRHWSFDAFAAQAVAARSFAAVEHATRTRSHYDVTDTASSQVYGGKAGHARAIEAVAVTRGIVLAYGERLVPGYYSSCCGGLAADALDAISKHPVNDVMPLRGRSGQDVCTEAPRFSWQTERGLRDVAGRLAAYARARRLDPLASMRKVRSVAIASTNAHGRPRDYHVTTGAGDVATIDAESLRRGLDYTTAGRRRPKPALWSSHLHPAVKGSRLRVNGFGFGHGAGLCQHGAEALGQRGEGWGAILSWYYPQVSLPKAWA